ncbi:hypothetical protein [Helicobacter sp. T3_23-1056]
MRGIICRFKSKIKTTQNPYKTRHTDKNTKDTKCQNLSKQTQNPQNQNLTIPNLAQPNLARK